MNDRNLSDDSLKLVKYRVLFAKRGYEAVLDRDSALVHDNLTPEAFVAWKIAEFSRRLESVRVPASWAGTAGDKPRYPRAATRKELEGRSVWVINRLDDDDDKYLRISFEVLDRSVRERFEYEEDQVDVLRQIRDALPCRSRGPTTPPGPAAPPAGPAPGATPDGSGGWMVE